jgi:hypothetical protein
MSDNWLQFIPTDPQYQPTTEMAERARGLMAIFVPEADAVSAEFKSSIEFFHPGGNWSGVKCPICGTDAEEWWGPAMKTASMKQFNDLGITAPCCGASVSLNDLRYIWPAGFGRFVLKAMNPNIPDLQSDEEAQLRTILGCNLRKIWLHL